MAGRSLEKQMANRVYLYFPLSSNDCDIVRPRILHTQVEHF